MTDEKVTERLAAVVRSELDLSSNPDEHEVRKITAQIVYRETVDEKYSLRDKECLIKDIFDSIRKLDVLQELIEDEEVSEIMVNGFEKIFIEKDTPVSLEELNEKLDILKKAMELRSNKITKAALKEVVPTYVNGDEINGGGYKN